MSPTPLPLPRFTYDAEYDVNDGKAWDEHDIEDLQRSLAAGASIKDAAHFLCRAGTLAEVEAKARELGLIGN